MLELLAQNFAIVGGLLAAIPVFLHMLRRTPAARMPFSIVRFLPSTLPVTTRRSRLQHWPLMLLRILAVILLALAFSRPFQRLTVERSRSTETGRRLAILLDGSASMRRDGLRDALQNELRNVTSDLSPQDIVSITRYSTISQPLLTSEEWRQADPGSRQSLIDRALENYEPDWRATDTGRAMLEAADEVSRERSQDSEETVRKVIVITDFQEGSQLDVLRSGAWPDNVTSDLHPVAPAETGNAGLSLSEDRKSGRIRVRLTNSGDSTSGQYTLQPFDKDGKPAGTAIQADVAPGQRRTLTLPDSSAGAPQIAGVELVGDSHPFDNVADLPTVEKQVHRVAHVGTIDANDSETMRYYLQRVLDGDESEPIEVIDLLQPDSLAVPPPADIRLVFVTDKVPENLLEPLRAFVNRGGVILIAMASVEMAESVKALLPDLASVEEATVADYAMLSSPDLTSSLLAPFADARFADFSSIRIWHHRILKMTEPATQSKVLARFDSGGPAILETLNASGGRIYTMATGWQPADSQWALSSRFPPMISRLLRIAYPKQSGNQIFEAGTAIVPTEMMDGSQWTLVAPDGTTSSSSNLKTPSAETLTPDGNREAGADKTPAAIVLDTPGRWRLSSEAPEGPQSMDLLVTVAASESRTAPLPRGQLQAMGLSAAKVSDADGAPVNPDTASQLDATELESRQKFWRYFLIAGMSCLLLESVLTGLLEKRQQVASVQ